MSLGVLSIHSASSGREAELQLLVKEHHDAKSAGHARFVFIRGPRGVGKTHLVTQLARTLSAQGVNVFEGGAVRDARATWGLFSPLGSELLTAARRDGTSELTVARLTRALEPLRGAAASSTADEKRLQLFDGVAELVTLASRHAPLFIFSDVDAADRSSLELLRYLAAVASTPESKVGGLFVLTFREDGELPDALAEILRHVPGRTLPLSGLDVDGIRAFLARHEIVEKLLAATGGNPEALGELLERPVAAVDFFARRVERLADTQREVLTLLALSPESLTAEAVSRVLGSDAAPTLDALLRERLVTVRVVDGRSAWKLAREGEKASVLAELSDSARSPLALKLGRELEANGRLVAAAELLFSVSEDAGAPVAAKAADELAARGALEEASAWYARAAASIPSVALAWGRVLEWLGYYRGAVRRLLSVREGERSQLALEATRHLLKLGRVRFAEATLQFARRDAALKNEADAVHAELLLIAGRSAEVLALPESSLAVRQTKGKALLIAGEAAKAQELFARNAQESNGDARLLAAARLNEGVAAYKRGERDHAIECWNATLPESRPLHAHAQANLGSVYAESGDFELALSHLSQSLAAFSRFGSVREVAMAANNLSRLHHTLGDLARATELAEHALRLSQRLSDGYVEASAHLNLGAIELDRREYTAARRELDSARAGFEKLGNDSWAALAAALKARAHLGAGERAQAEQELARRCVEKGAPSMQAASLEVELTRADLCLALNDVLGATHAASRARELLLEKPELEAPIRTYFLFAKLRQAANDMSGAAAEFQRANRLLDELVQRVPPARRQAFLAVHRRAEVIAAVEPELRLPRAMASLAAPPEVATFNGLVGRSAALQRITRQLEPVGRSATTVLIRGESGTGKEVLADALHALSPRKHMPLVKVNCAAMVEELLLSELFGHEKGAFTGATRERKGRFELADGGTIFLDEIGDISPKAQVALLRVLQEREFERVGGNKTIKVDVRVICATNRDLEQLISRGQFRADLYYRLKGVMLELPSLRERLEDLPLLTSHFLSRVAADRNEPLRKLSQRALALLAKHTWPGNIRELENVISSASIFAEGEEVDLDAFSHISELRALSEGPKASQTTVVPMQSSSSMQVPPSPTVVAAPVSASGELDYYELARKRDISLKDLRHEMEMQCIRRALEDAGGNISEAARLLKMKRSRLSQIVNGESELKGVAHGDEE